MSFPFRSIHCVADDHDRCQDGAAVTCSCACHVDREPVRIRGAA